VSVGIPLPRGLVVDSATLSLEDASRTPMPVQSRVLDRWPDGSIRWVLLDFIADSTAGDVSVRLDAAGAPGRDAHRAFQVSGSDDLTVDTGRAAFRFRRGGPFPFAEATPVAGSTWRTDLTVALGGAPGPVRLRSAQVVESGPVRTSVEVLGVIEAGPLAFKGRVDLYAQSACARITVKVTNPRAAVHPRGQWGLGDGGSLLLRSLELRFRSDSPIAGISASVEADEALIDEELPFSLLQESSGGDHWNSRTHLARNGQVSLRFRGYRLVSGGRERTGRRAEPQLRVRTPTSALSVVVPEFWQTFPCAIDASSDAITVGWLPADVSAPHELQGGEAKTFTAVAGFDGQALAHVHEPQVVYPPADWVCATEAVPFLLPRDTDRDGLFDAVAGLGLDRDVGFVAKRERADEYGWRNFGDMPADHESAFRPPDDPFVSHYNNQYDAIAGFAMQFLRTGDRRWWQLMHDLARHVRDIDIYHTIEDKAAYSGGLFWHTAHYIDAGLSTHRTYPAGGPTGGGPSAEHNYNIGLMLHSFLTGDEASREAAIGLGRWVIHMDDGRRTVFRWLSRSPTGHASFTNGFHGPGRGAGHSVLACIVAHRLSGDAEYLAKADELIRRTIHPADDPEALELLDAERRWSYTAFLQALGVYLWHQTERGVTDGGAAYARASLLAYARWMLERERPYLDNADALEYPTETWVAQDARKADVFLWAAIFADDDEGRKVWLAGARRYFDYALSTLGAMPSRHFTRPVVIVLSHAVRRSWLLARAGARDLPIRHLEPFDEARLPRVRFESQRTIALRRAMWLAGCGLAAMMVALYSAW
jgi:hypothetical protein